MNTKICAFTLLCLQDDSCTAWTTWPEIFDVYFKEYPNLYYCLDFIFYVGWAVSMAGLAVVLVKVSEEFYICNVSSI